MIEAGIKSHLSADVGVSAIVASRIYPLIIPQHAAGEPTRMPCLVYTRIDSRRQQKFCGTDGLVRSVFQFDSYAVTFATSEALAAATRASLIDFVGTMGTDTVKACFLDLQFATTEPDPGLYRATQRFILWHDENP